MIRWSYLVPRLLVAAALVVAVSIGLDPFVKWSVIRAGQAMTGAKVDIDSWRSTFRTGDVRVRGIAVANPNHPDRNWFEIEEADLSFDTRSLLMGRFVVRDGQVRGLRIDGERATSGALPQHERTTDALSGKPLVEWLADLKRLLRDPVVNEMRSVVVARELMERWPREYEAAAAEVKDVQQRVRTLRTNFEEARHKPLDHLDAVRRVVTDVATIRGDLERLRLKANDLVVRANEDRKRVELARRTDIDRIEQALKIASLDAERVTEYLLGPELAPYASDLVEWVRWSKEWLDVAGDPPRPARLRGRDIEFPRVPPAPDWWIQRIAVAGELSLGNRPTAFEGVLTGLTNRQSITGEPTRFSARIEGLHPARFDAVADNRDGSLKHTVTFDCPSLALGRRAMGKADGVLVTLDEGNARLWMRVELADRQVNGRIVWKQDEIRFGASVAEELGGPRTARFLSTALARATHLHAQVDLRGPIEKPLWTVRANLGPELVEGIEDAARRELAERRDALVRRLHVEVAREIAKLDEKIRHEQDKVLAQLNVGEEVLRELQQVAAATGAIDPLRKVIESSGIRRKIESSDIYEKLEASGIQQRLEDRIRSARLPFPASRGEGAAVSSGTSGAESR